MVEVFKTDISDVRQARRVLDLLGERWPQYLANFDLEDCDRILRIESKAVQQQDIVLLLQQHGHRCEVLN